MLEGERYDIGLQKDYLKLIYDMLKTEKNPNNRGFNQRGDRRMWS
ncbi:Hypothetical protein ACI5QM_03040 [Bacillus subtilis]